MMKLSVKRKSMMMVWPNDCCDFCCGDLQTIDVVYVPVQRKFNRRLLFSAYEILSVCNRIYLIFFALSILVSVSFFFLVTSTCVIFKYKDKNILKKLM